MSRIHFEATTDLIPRGTITTMAAAWRESTDQIAEAFRMIAEAEDRLKAVFGVEHYGFSVQDRHDEPDFRKPDSTMKRLRKDAWRCLIDRLQLRQFMSVEAAQELAKQLDKGCITDGVPLPEVTEEVLIAQIRGMFESIPEQIRLAQIEVFKMLRPYTHHKTNDAWKIGHKVILTGMITGGYKAGTWRVTYGQWAGDKLRALDNVFHSLDGKGMIKDHTGPTARAIEAIPAGEDRFSTDYFRGRVFGNGNLHLEFLRLDLVDRINATSMGSNELPGTNKNRQ